MNKTTTQTENEKALAAIEDRISRIVADVRGFVPQAMADRREALILAVEAERDAAILADMRATTEAIKAERAAALADAPRVYVDAVTCVACGDGVSLEDARFSAIDGEPTCSECAACGPYVDGHACDACGGAGEREFVDTDDETGRSYMDASRCEYCEEGFVPPLVTLEKLPAMFRKHYLYRAPEANKENA